MAKRTGKIEPKRIIPTIGVGDQPNEILIVSDYPGTREAESGIPLTGKTGDEVNRYLSGVNLPHREDVRIVNLIRTYRADGNYDEADVRRDEPELIQEIYETQPKVIVTLGRWSTRWCLGDVAMDEVGGLPWWYPRDRFHALTLQGEALGLRFERGSESDVDRPIVFSIVNPAAGFRSPEVQALVSYSFRQLGAFLDGKVQPRELFEDEFPNPTYLQVPDDVAWLRGALQGVKRLYVDSEGFPDRIWSLQFAIQPGTAYLIRMTQKEVLREFMEWLLRERPHVTYHGSLHDFSIMRGILQRLKIPIEGLYGIPFDDTQIMSYLLQVEPIGLKPNCVRHCNMQMQDYMEVLGDAQLLKAQKYLIQIFDAEKRKYRERQEEEFKRINATPLLDKSGKPKRDKAGNIKTRKTRVLPKLPMSDLHKAAKRVLNSARPYELWQDQREDLQVMAYNLEIE